MSIPARSTSPIATQSIAAANDAYRPIDALLQASQRRERLLRLGSAVAIVFLAGSALAAVFAVAIPLHPSAALQQWFWASESALLTACIAGAILWPSRLLRPGDPRLRSLLRSAVELRGIDLTRPESPSGVLVLAQARFAAARLAGLDLRDAMPARLVWVLLVGGALSIGLIGAAASQTRLRDGLAGLWHPVPAPSGKGSAREPITGDIELTYLYPAHTHMATRTVAGTAGEIQAPAGTQVRITTRADRPVREAFLVVNGKALPLTVTASRSLSGSLLVDKSGSYLFRLQPSTGAAIEGPPIPITVQVDAPPEVLLDSPAEDLEVDPKQTVVLRYRANDDYGISETRLRYRQPGASEDSRAALQHPSDPPTHLAGEARFDLAPLHLAPGDRVTYAIEALDNDGVAGAKLGQSKSQTLKVFSAAEHHHQAIASVRALWERLVDLLGDRLEDAANRDAPNTDASAPSTVDTRALGLAMDLLKSSTDLRKDTQSPKALWQALANIGRAERERASETMDARDLLRTDGAADGQLRLHSRSAEMTALRTALSAETVELEHSVLYLEALLDRQTMDDLVALTHELASRRRELTELIDRYNKTKSPELRAEIAAQLQRLKDRQRELMNRMAELAKGISDEHLNREATEELSKQHDIGSGLDEAEQKLASGDLEGALKALDSVGNTLEELQRRLTNAAAGQGADQGFSQLSHEISDLKEGLAQLTTQEKHLQTETDKIRERARLNAERHSPRSTQMLEKLRAETQRAQAKLAQIPPGALPQRILGNDALALAKERTEELAKALAVSDLDQAAHSVDQAIQQTEALQLAADRETVLRSLSDFDPSGDATGNPVSPEQKTAARQRLMEATPLLKDIQETLSKMLPDESTMLSKEDQARLGQLAREQANAREKQVGLQQKLRQIGSEAPIFDPAAQQAMDEAGDRMQAAQQSLALHRAGQAEGEEQGALQQLGKLEQALREGTHGEGSGGVPNPFSVGSPSQMGGEGGENGDLADREKVVVPGADQYRVPPEFRRDILDAMKQRAPEAYEEQVRKYYREIVK
jgi:hypothetical protein